MAARPEVLPLIAVATQVRRMLAVGLLSGLRLPQRAVSWCATTGQTTAVSGTKAARAACGRWHVAVNLAASGLCVPGLDCGRRPLKVRFTKIGLRELGGIASISLRYRN